MCDTGKAGVKDCVQCRQIRSGWTDRQLCQVVSECVACETFL